MTRDLCLVLEICRQPSCAVSRMKIFAQNFLSQLVASNTSNTENLTNECIIAHFFLGDYRVPLKKNSDFIILLLHVTKKHFDNIFTELQNQTGFPIFLNHMI